MALATNSVVAIDFELSPKEGVGAVGFPVNVGDDFGANTAFILSHSFISPGWSRYMAHLLGQRVDDTQGD